LFVPTDEVLLRDAGISAVGTFLYGKSPYTNKIITAVEATKLSGSSALNQPPRSPTKCAGDAKEDRQD